MINKELEEGNMEMVGTLPQTFKQLPVVERYGGGAFSFSRLISGITEKFNTEYDVESIKKFITEQPDLGSGARAFNQAIEKTTSNIKWMTENYSKLSTWLNAFS